MEIKIKEAAAANKRTVTEDDYAQLVDVNPNLLHPPSSNFYFACIFIL